MNQFLKNDFGKSSERVVGIDLGATNGLVAYMDLTAAKTIHPGGRKLVPSIVSIGGPAEIVAGDTGRELSIQAEPPQAFQNLVNEVVDSSRD